MTHILRPVTLTLLAALLPALAEDPGRFSVAGSLALGTDSMKDLTGSTLGGALEAAWDAPASVGPLRLGLSLSRFGTGSHAVGFLDGDTRQQRTLNGPSLFTRQAYIAARSQVTADVDLHLGVSLNWHRLGSGYPEADGQRAEAGTKLGLRAGLGYRLTSQLTLEGTFQWLEVARSPDRSHLHAPSWFQVGARWSF